MPLELHIYTDITRVLWEQYRTCNIGATHLRLQEFGSSLLLLQSTLSSQKASSLIHSPISHSNSSGPHTASSSIQQKDYNHIHIILCQNGVQFMGKDSLMQCCSSRPSSQSRFPLHTTFMLTQILSEHLNLLQYTQLSIIVRIIMSTDWRGEVEYRVLTGAVMFIASIKTVASTITDCTELDTDTTGSTLELVHWTFSCKISITVIIFQNALFTYQRVWPSFLTQQLEFVVISIFLSN